MTVRRTSSLRRLAAAALVAAAAGGLLSCNDGDGGNGTTGPGNPGPLTVTCSLSAGTIPAGSPDGITVTATISRDGAAVAGQTVVFSTTLGAVTPDVVVSGADGKAVATFRASGQAGIAVITTRVFASVPQDQVGTTCSVTVTGATDPELAVTVSSPAQLAGIELTVTYDPSEVTLKEGGAQAKGTLAAVDCFPIASDNGAGTTTLVVACPTMRAVSGTQVATFAFDNDGFATIVASDFGLQCVGYDEDGFQVAVACSKSVTQL